MTLGQDLALLALPRRGGEVPVALVSRLGFALRGSQLADLALTGRIRFVNGRIVSYDTSRTGDRMLDNALAALAAPAGADAALLAAGPAGRPRPGPAVSQRPGRRRRRALPRAGPARPSARAPGCSTPGASTNCAGGSIG